MRYLRVSSWQFQGTKSRLIFILFCVGFERFRKYDLQCARVKVDEQKLECMFFLSCGRFLLGLADMCIQALS